MVINVVFVGFDVSANFEINFTPLTNAACFFVYVLM